MLGIKTQVANTIIAKDISANESMTINPDTVASYIKSLKRIF